MLTSSSNTKSDSQTPLAERRDQGRTGSSADKTPSDYYYDDSTGYEIYREEDEGDEESEKPESTD